PPHDTPESRVHERELASRLKNLARPSPANWWELVRRLVPVLAESGDPGFRGIRDVVLGRVRHGLPLAAELDAALCEALELELPAVDGVRLAELFDRIVRYRSKSMSRSSALRNAGDRLDRMS